MRLYPVFALAIMLYPHHATAATWFPDQYTTTVAANVGPGIPSIDSTTDVCTVAVPIPVPVCSATPVNAVSSPGFGGQASAEAAGAFSKLAINVFGDPLGPVTASVRESGVFRRQPGTSGATKVRVSAFFPTISLQALATRGVTMDYEVSLSLGTVSDPIVPGAPDVTTTGELVVDATGTPSLTTGGIDVGATLTSGPSGSSVLVQDLFIDEVLGTVGAGEPAFEVVLFKRLSFNGPDPGGFVESAVGQLVDPFMVTPGDRPNFSFRNILELEDADTPAPIPLPAGLPLLAGGLLVLACATRMRRPA